MSASSAGPAASWTVLHGPIMTRGLAASGQDGHMTGGTLAQLFDVIIHRQHVTPSVPT